jgi:hypothetical protein
MDRLAKEVDHLDVSFLPDQPHFLYIRSSSVSENDGIYIGSVDRKPEQQSLKRLSPGDDVVYSTGHILFAGEDSLMAQAFDPSRLEPAGEAVPIALGYDSASMDPPSSASANGMLAYLTGAESDNWFTWFDRSGKALGKISGFRWDAPVNLSPDGAFVRGDPKNTNIWLHDFPQDATRQVHV